MRHTMRRIWQESGGSRLRVATTALTGCVNVGVSLLFVWTTKSIVDAAVAPAHTIPTSLVMLLVACLLSQLLLPAPRRRLESVAYTRYADNMRRRLLYHMLCEDGGRDSVHYAAGHAREQSICQKDTSSY